MKNKLVVVPTPMQPIKPCPGFEKKELAKYKLDIMGLCGFAVYCSSNAGNYLRFRREEFADLTEKQRGSRTYPSRDPRSDLPLGRCATESREAGRERGSRMGSGQDSCVLDADGRILAVDAHQPHDPEAGGARAHAHLVPDPRAHEELDRRLREVDRLFTKWPGRFVVGLSTGTMDDDWVQRVEIGTSAPSARIRAIRRLQDAGVPTYGMLCPIFPDAAAHLDDLLDEIRTEHRETIWAEPYNDRANWIAVRDGYPLNSRGRRWLTRVYEQHDWAAWSEYATDLYAHLRDRARADAPAPDLASRRAASRRRSVGSRGRRCSHWYARCGSPG